VVVAADKLHFIAT